MAREIAIRLSVEDAERVKAILANVGTEGGKSLAEAFEIGASRGAQAFARLERSLDPVVRAQETYAAAQLGINRAVEAGLTSQDRANQLLDMAGRRYQENAAAIAKLSGQAGAASAEFQRLLNTFDPVTASAQRMTAELRDLNAAQRAGITIAGGYENAHAAIVEKYDAAALAARRLAEQQRVLIEQARAEQVAANGQSMWNRYAGVSDPNASAGSARRSASVFEELFRAEEQAAKAQADLNAQARQWLTIAEPSVVAQRQLNEQRALGETLLSSGKITQAQFNSGMEALTRTSGAASLAMRNLGIQSFDVVSQLSAGAPVMTVFIQQGAQVAQVAAASGMSMGAMARGVALAVASINPFAAGIAAATLVVGGFAVASEVSARQTAALQNTLRATRADYVALSEAADAAARAVAGSTSLGTSEARAAAAQFAAQPNFSGGQAEIERMLRLADDLAARLGIAFPEAVAKMAPAWRDASALARDLEGRLIGFNSELTRSIELQVRSGDAAGASARLFDRLKQATGGASEQIKTGLQKALQELANELSITGSGATSFGDVMLSWGERYVRFLKDIVVATKDAANAIANLKPASATPAQSNPVPNSIGATAGGGGLSASDIMARRGQAEAKQGTEIFDSVAAQSALPVDQLNFARRIMLAESQGRIGAASSAGAQGLMGLMPGTAAELGVNPSDPFQNVRGGLKYVAQIWAKYGGDPVLAAMAYNWGPGNVDRFLASRQALTDIPIETRRYVLKVAEVDLATRFGDPSLPVPPAYVPPPAQNQQTLSKIDAAVARATSAGGVTVTREGAQEDIKAYREALRLLADQGETTGSQVERLKEALQGASKTMVDAIPAADKLLREIQDQTSAADRLAAAHIQGDAAVAEVIARTRAEGEARQVTARGSAEYAALVEVLTQKYVGLAASLGRVDLNKTVAEVDRATEAQLRVNAAYDGTQKSVTAAQNAERAYAEVQKSTLKPGTEEFTAEVRRLSEAYDRGSAATAGFQHAQQSATAVMDTLGTTADRIGQALVDATISGEKGMVNLANTAKAAVVSMLTEFAKLGVINPLLNSVFGTDRSTLGAGLTVLTGGGAGGTGGASATSSGGNGLFGGVSNALTIGRGTDFLGITDFGGQLSGLTDMIGLTGQGGLLSSLTSGLSGLLSTGVNGVSLAAATNSALASMGGALGPATSSSVLSGMGGATIGGALAGAGIGFGLGSFGGGLLQSALNKTGPGPTIGAGAGTLAGLALLPVLGPLGPILGGLLGGAGGGLIGPRPATPFSATGLSANDNGLVEVGRTVSQIVNTQAEVAALQQSVTQLNSVLSAFNARIAASSISENTDTFGQRRILAASTGDWNKLAVGQGGGRPADLASAFSELRFSAANPDVNAVIGNRPFVSLEALADALKRVSDNAAFLANTVPALTDLTTKSTAFTDALAGLSKQYQDAIDYTHRAINAGDLSAAMTERLRQAETDLVAAREQASLKTIDNVMRQFDVPLGSLPTQLQAIAKSFDEAIADVRAAVGTSAAVTDRLRLAEEQLATSRDRQTQRALEAAGEATFNYDAALTIRYLSATADPTTARLAAADEAARLARKELDKTLVDMWGESIRGAQAYADQMALLDRTLAAERKAIQDEANRARLQADETAAAQAKALAEQNAAWRRTVYDALTQDNTAAGQFARQLKAINDNFDAAATKARELGLAEDVLQQARARQLQAAADQRDLTGLQLIANQQDALTGFLDSLRASNASPADQLALAQQGFARALEQAQKADINTVDLSSVTRAGAAVVEAGKAFYATGQGAADLEMWVRSSVEALGRQLNLPAFGGDLEVGLAAAVNPLKDEMARLREQVTGLRATLAAGLGSHVNSGPVSLPPQEITVAPQSAPPPVALIITAGGSAPSAQPFDIGPALAASLAPLESALQALTAATVGLNGQMVDGVARAVSLEASIGRLAEAVASVDLSHMVVALPPPVALLVTSASPEPPSRPFETAPGVASPRPAEAAIVRQVGAVAEARPTANPPPAPPPPARIIELAASQPAAQQLDIGPALAASLAPLEATIGGLAEAVAAIDLSHVVATLPPPVTAPVTSASPQTPPRPLNPTPGIALPRPAEAAIVRLVDAVADTRPTAEPRPAPPSVARIIELAVSQPAAQPLDIGPALAASLAPLEASIERLAEAVTSIDLSHVAAKVPLPVTLPEPSPRLFDAVPGPALPKPAEAAIARQIDAGTEARPITEPPPAPPPAARIIELAALQPAAQPLDIGPALAAALEPLNETLQTLAERLIASSATPSPAAVQSASTEPDIARRVADVTADDAEAVPPPAPPPIAQVIDQAPPQIPVGSVDIGADLAALLEPVAEALRTIADQIAGTTAAPVPDVMPRAANDDVNGRLVEDLVAALSVRAEKPSGQADNIERPSGPDAADLIDQLTPKGGSMDDLTGNIVTFPRPYRAPSPGALDTVDDSSPVSAGESIITIIERVTSRMDDRLTDLVAIVRRDVPTAAAPDRQASRTEAASTSEAGDGNVAALLTALRLELERGVAAAMEPLKDELSALREEVSALRNEQRIRRILGTA